MLEVGTVCSKSHLKLVCGGADGIGLQKTELVKLNRDYLHLKL